MFAIKKNGAIVLTRGDYAAFDVEIFTEEGEPYIPEAGDTVTFTVKKNTRTTDILIQKTGTFIEIQGEDTESLSYGSYVYDVQLTYENGRRDTFITPTEFQVTEEVTF